MPHLVILYTPNLDQPASQGGVDMSGLCRALADAMLAVRDEQDRQVFPTGGTRVLAYPATHFAIADGGAAGEAAGLGSDYAFVYMNVRMAKGRSALVHQRVGETLNACVRQWFGPQFERRPIGVTVQVDEGHEVFDAKNSSLHPLFKKLCSRNALILSIIPLKRGVVDVPRPVPQAACQPRQLGQCSAQRAGAGRQCLASRRARSQSG